MKIQRIIKSNIKFILLILCTLTILLNFSIFLKAKENNLPPLKIHPLPTNLQQWKGETQDNYFQEIQPHLAGYLIWSHFPIKVYIQPPNDNLSPAGLTQFQQWQKAVRISIESWNPYLPLIEIENADKADILIYRRHPQIKAEINPETGLYNLPRAKAATTTVKFYLTETQPQQLRHTMSIEINPHQTFDYLVTNITHELGHALGIWGHSLNTSDVMYHSHSQKIPAISPQDINTLKKIYQQPTRLGWNI